MALNEIKRAGPYALYLDDVRAANTIDSFALVVNGQTIEIKESQTGDTIIDLITNGAECNLTANFSGATLEQMGSFSGVTYTAGATKDQIIVSSSVGVSQYDNAKELTLRPIIDCVDSADPAEWLKFFKCSTINQSAPVFGNEQYSWTVLFTVFPDKDPANLCNLFQIGLVDV